MTQLQTRDETTPVPGEAHDSDPVLMEAARGWLDDLFAPWVKALGLRVQAITAHQTVLGLAWNPLLCREGGTVCGQALMAAADTAMVLALCAQQGRFRPMTTVSLNISFMRAVAQGELRITARVLKPGKTLAFGEVDLTDAQGRLAAQVTTTYAML
jgi:uncharacterized protein (TIGR00369 family)